VCPPRQRPWPGGGGCPREVLGWGAGPSHSSLASAFALAGYDEVADGGGKEHRVFQALRNADDDLAMRLVEELLELLRTDRTFRRENDPAVRRLQSELQRIGATLSDEGFIDWPISSQEGNELPVSTLPTLSASGGSTGITIETSEPNLALLVSSLRRLPSALRPLRARRRRGRDRVQMNDEYDLQDAVETALRLLVSDVRPEERSPSSAGSSSVIDFLLRKERIAVEVKVTKPGRAEKKIKQEVLVDIHDYKQHPTVDTLVIAVYDLASTFNNPVGFESDLTSCNENLDVRVVVAGWPSLPEA